MKIIKWFIRVILLPIVFIKTSFNLGKKALKKGLKARKRYKRWVSIKNGLIKVLNIGASGYSAFTMVEPHLNKNK